MAAKLEDNLPTDEYIKIIRESLASVKNLIPPGTRLLFASLNKKRTPLTELDSEELMAGIVSGSSNSKTLSGYVECYSLVSACNKGEGMFEPLKAELEIDVHEFGTLDPLEREIAVRKWINSPYNEERDFFCDKFAEEILPSGWRVFIPDRVPEKFSNPDDNCAFISILQSTLKTPS